MSNYSSFDPFKTFVRPCQQRRRDAVCFVCLTSAMGGLTTLVARKAAWCRRNGIASLIVTAPGELLHLYQSSATEVIVLTDRELDFAVAMVDEQEATFARLAARFAAYESVYFETYCNHTMFLANGMMRYLPSSAGGLYLIQDRTLQVFEPALATCLVEAGVIYGMNDGSFSQHEERWGVKFRGKVIFPIPIERLSQAGQSKPDIQEALVVTIGRLDPLKGYIEALIRGLPEAKKRNPKIRLKIIGDGPLRSAWVAVTKKLGVQGDVEFAGAQPPELLPAMIKRGHVYVGMGTTLLIAAQVGLPCVVAYPWDTLGESPGYFGEHDGFEIGERMDSLPVYSCWDKILELIDDPSLCVQSARKAAEKVANDFLEDGVMARQVEFYNSQSLTFCNPPPPAFSKTQGELRRFVKRLVRHSPKAMAMGRATHRLLRSLVGRS